MYTGIIGKKFLRFYNKKYNTNYSAEEFFKDVYWPLFFDDENYLQCVTNSPFDQLYKQKKHSSADLRKEELEKFMTDVETKEPHMGLAVGYPAMALTKTTSGQTTSMKLPIDKNEVYATWFGAALGILVKGGQIVFLDKEKVFEILLEGWKEYRKRMTELDLIPPNKINTWNGHWLYNRINENGYFNPFEKKNESLELPTIEWINVIFALAKLLGEKDLNSYIAKIGQMNSTYGFITIKLPAIKRYRQLLNAYFGEIDRELIKQLDTLYKTEFGFITACKGGSIGIKELQPKGLRQFINDKYKTGKFFNFQENRESQINYSIYKTWIIAMLENKELLPMATTTAEAFLSYQAGEEKARKIRINNIKTIMESKSRATFINNLIPLMEVEGNYHEMINALVTEIDKMPADKFPYFLTLIKFQYAYKQRGN